MSEMSAKEAITKIAEMVGDTDGSPANVVERVKNFVDYRNKVEKEIRPELIALQKLANSYFEVGDNRNEEA